MGSLAQQELIPRLQAIVGQEFVLTDEAQTLPYRQGYRFGEGRALAVVKPADLWQQWQVLEACVAADVMIITQAANTGLTGGSTPAGEIYEREVVIINTLRIDGIQLINDAKEVICLAGSTLNELEKTLKPHQREPHSVIGSSCIGASVLGGVCNNSGGALVQRGPAYTEMALYAHLDSEGRLHLVNHLGVHLGEDVQTVMRTLQQGDYKDKDIESAVGVGHDHHYCQHVRQIDEPTPARFNADPSRLHEASGCAGKLMVFAVRLDTFPLESQSQVFYIGSNDANEFNDIRRTVLATFKNLPISGEYIHRDAYDIAAKYGKDTFWVIKKFGTHNLPKMFALKNKIDRVGNRFGFLPKHLSDRVMQMFSHFLPQHLPKSMQDYRNRYQHHLILKMGGEGIKEAQDFLQSYFADNTKDGGFFVCNETEAQAAMLHRFAVAGAAVRYRAVHHDEVEDIVALDIALRRNDREWQEVLPNEIEDKLIHKLYYGHFFCHVFHQDYLVKKGVNCHQLEEQMLALLDKRGAKYPAEHNVGHLYTAEPSLQNFYQYVDPTNSFNAGIGKTSALKHWR
ncbi:D-lactate dehydrogenase [Psychrobacter sp. I-STPA6b]|uniref:D-lactate dehydrogenase n=1 Tax=Psychrobacter sp. I-STPA6b TaxID=2585718 RepID=UPI0022214E38|nr:D-lactate dehydrogenase [Psychrobacter sp. I-STPA6b]